MNAMKFSTRSEDDYARAFGTLELPPNASREAVEQAYRDLREVWDPARFQTDERLKRKAEEQLYRIEEAYELLRDYHARHDLLLEGIYGRAKTGRTPTHTASKTDPHSPMKPASLADTVFAETTSGRGTRLPIALVVIGVVAVVVLAVLFLGRPAGSRPPDGQGAAPPTVTTPAPQGQANSVPPPAGAEPSRQKAEPPPAPARSTPEPAPAVSTTPSQVQKTAPAQPRAGAARPDREPGLVPPKTATPAARVPSPAPRREPETKPELVRGPEEGGVAPEEERRVMNVLGQKSAAAQNILDGNTDQFRVMSWRVTRKDGGEFWAHIVAESAAGGTTHLIWAVDPAKETIRPLSQGARDLEKSALPKAAIGS